MMTSFSFPVLVAWSVVLLVVHVMLQARFASRELGLAWNAGPRDENLEPRGKHAGRARRASVNFRETYPAFVGLALALHLVDPQSGWGYAGALIWFAARIVYLPLYMGGVPYVRSAVWAVSMLGLGLMFLSVVF